MSVSPERGRTSETFWTDLEHGGESIQTRDTIRLDGLHIAAVTNTTDTRSYMNTREMKVPMAAAANTSKAEHVIVSPMIPPPVFCGHAVSAAGGDVSDAKDTKKAEGVQVAGGEKGGEPSMANKTKNPAARLSPSRDGDKSNESPHLPPHDGEGAADSEKRDASFTTAAAMGLIHIPPTTAGDANEAQDAADLLPPSSATAASLRGGDDHMTPTPQTISTINENDNNSLSIVSAVSDVASATDGSVITTNENDDNSLSGVPAPAANADGTVITTNENDDNGEPEVVAAQTGGRGLCNNLVRRVRQVKELPLWVHCLVAFCGIVGLPISIIFPVLEMKSNSQAQDITQDFSMLEQIKCGTMNMLVDTTIAAPTDAPSCGGAIVPESIATSFPGKWLVLTVTGLQLTKVTLTTCNALSKDLGNDTRLRVYKSQPSGDRECIAGEDDDGPPCSFGKKLSTVTFAAEDSATYHILADGGKSAGGIFYLDVFCAKADSPVTVPPSEQPTGPSANELNESSSSPSLPSTTQEPGQLDFCEVAMITSDKFGHNAVAVSGNIAVVGAPIYHKHVFKTSSVTVFNRESSGWVAQAKLLPRGRAATNLFGSSVGIYGSTVIVGAEDDHNSQGSVTIFVNVGSARMEQEKLLPSDRFQGARFGAAVAIHQDAIVVGAPGDEDNRRGSAYIFARRGQTWVQVSKLRPSNDMSDVGRFGSSIAIYEDTVLVGAPYDNSDRGSVYIYVQKGAQWMVQDKLMARDTIPGDFFGNSVSLIGDTAIIGAYYQDSQGGWSGAAYIFARIGSTWKQVAKLLPDDGAAYDHFGFSVVLLSEEAAIVGSVYDDDNGLNSGSAYLFVRLGDGTWKQQSKLLPGDGLESEMFGSSLAADGVTAIVGTYGGKVYVYEQC